jgi:hypothetical protein
VKTLVPDRLEIITLGAAILSTVMLMVSDDDPRLPAAPAAAQPTHTGAPPPAPAISSSPSSRKSGPRDAQTAPGRHGPRLPDLARAVEAPGAFPLSEGDWRDALPEEAGLEPDTDFDPVPVWLEPLDDPWGGQWGDQGGNSG